MLLAIILHLAAITRTKGSRRPVHQDICLWQQGKRCSAKHARLICTLYRLAPPWHGASSNFLCFHHAIIFLGLQPFFAGGGNAFPIHFKQQSAVQKHLHSRAYQHAQPQACTLQATGEAQEDRGRNACNPVCKHAYASALLLLPCATDGT